ncbi:unnamed protein product, partial [Phaeothamnion confervicola]
ATAPLALHQLVVVEPGGSVVIPLAGLDYDGDALSATITQIPTAGALLQLSKVFSDFGYEPKDGSPILGQTAVTDKKNRVLYRRPGPEAAPPRKWGTFRYTVTDGSASSTEGVVTLVPPSGRLAGSDFAAGAELWAVCQQMGGLCAPATYEPTSHGTVMSFFISGAEQLVYDDGGWLGDRSLWHFRAPAEFSGNLGIAYGGTLEFDLSSFAGDFSAGNLNGGVPLAVLYCSKCRRNTGVTLAFPLAVALATAAPDAAAAAFEIGGATGAVAPPALTLGAATHFTLGLTESAGWIKDPENLLAAPWPAPTRCEMVEVLANLSELRIVGDLTRTHETVTLDSVYIRNAQAQLPICAQGSGSAAACTCS